MAPRKRSSFDSFPTGEPPRRSSAHRSDSGRPARSFSRSAYGSGDDGARRTPASSYSRRTTQAEYSRMRAKKKRKKAVVGVVAAIAAVLLIGAGAAFAYVNVLNGKLGANLDDATRDALASESTLTEPFYMLLMGTDKSAEREASAEYAGDTFRSDSMILARIDPQQKKVTLISIERDTYVDIEGYGLNKINAAYSLGGAALAVKTVSEYAGVPISHYAEIGFDAFKSAVDSLGGVEVDVPIEIDDDEAGGYLAAGPQTLNGDQALILCRSRHAYEDAGYGGGDYYRAANQRMVMGAVAKKLLASDPATIASTVTSLCDYITTDMSVTDIASLAVSMRGMDTSTDIYSTMNPTISAYEDGVWIEYSNAEAWSAMMQRVDAGLPPTVNEADSANNGGVTDGTIGGEYVAQAVLSDTGNTGQSKEVEVQNGSGVTGVAADAASLLTNQGYDITNTTDADSYGYSQTLVVYDDDDQAETARAIAEALGVGKAEKNEGRYTFDGAFLVIVGSDYR